MLKRLELSGFKSFARKTELVFDAPITAIVGPNGSGKSNIAEAFRWGLGEQSLKSLRGKRGEDLIFNGGGGGGSRLGRAAVSIAFDNTEKKFPVDYDEVVVTREVLRDGTNEYSINGTKVRLKDIYELLSSVSLGSSGHHIINQGEADRILNANLYERREMIEEALGLRLYQWKMEESEKKLDKTEDNIKQVESLRREIAPHLKFLKKQVEKIEKADEMRKELKALYLEYLKKEEAYLQDFRARIKNDKDGPAGELARTEEKLRAAEAAISHAISPDETSELAELENKLRQNARQKDELARGLGRLEGMIEIKGEKLSRPEEAAARMIDLARVEQVLVSLDSFLTEAEQGETLDAVRTVVGQIKNLLAKFRAEHHAPAGLSLADIEAEVAKLRMEKTRIEDEIKQLDAEEIKLARELADRKQEIDRSKEATRGAEREVFELRSRRSELRSQLETVRAHEEKLLLEEEQFKTEIREGLVLVNQEIKLYENFVLPAGYDAAGDRAEQEVKRRQIERLKIRLEDMGVEGTDVLSEYKETADRDAYLEREHNDLLKSKEDLKIVIKDLKERLDTEFKEGIVKINREFKKYFMLMFDGGDAELNVVAPEKKRKEVEDGDGENGLPVAFAQSFGVPMEEVIKEGIDIAVSLPRKKIKGLQMLSGGERALTSIALLFAMSSVNPPPFLILDETDAALDEANSRKYGDMIVTLSKSSQLILITHNRETMSRAGIIYGITMGGDGISKLLSIRFEEAEAYAK
ncbi:MAG: AAA family ATPase [Candidatus Vogelbacteria bacterium]|nr:AAA family ATPase [Candidatus Vogelbacteria bacterium]